MNFDWEHFLRFLLDYLLILWFYRAIPARGNSAVWRTGLYLLCCTAIAPSYFLRGWLQGSLPRFTYRIAVYSVSLAVGKRLDWQSCLYFGTVGALSTTIYFNISLTPLLRKHWSVTELSPSTVLVYACSFLLLTLTSRLMHFEKAREVTKPRWIALAILVICEVYIKSTLEQISIGSTIPQITVCFIILQLFILAAMVLFEFYLYTNEIQEANRMADMAAAYRYESAVHRQSAEEDLRRLHHDMKNHLLAMRELSGDNERLDSYIGALVSDLNGYSQVIETGNTLINGLLAEKLRAASKYGIDLTVQLDFRPCEGVIGDVDICVIFGNLIDNAIEASRKVNDLQRRSILIKSHEIAGNLSVTFSNFYEGTLKMSEGELQTTKEDRRYHGIGLSSVRRSVEKYGGALSIQNTPERRLIITVLLPIQS